MPEIFRVPLTAGFLALHADPDSETGLSLEVHNGEEGVLVSVMKQNLVDLSRQNLVDLFLGHSQAQMSADAKAAVKDPAS
jgi:hypothetical protein